MARQINRLSARLVASVRKPGLYADGSGLHLQVTVHGFRSTFRDWAAEYTNYPREVVEMALAHAIPDATEAAYRRGDLFDKRRQLMDAWSDFIYRKVERVCA